MLLFEQGVCSNTRMPKRFGDRVFYDTPLERWLVANKILPARFVREAGFSRQQFQRIRSEGTDYAVSYIRRSVQTARRLTNERVVAADLFELNGD